MSAPKITTITVDSVDSLQSTIAQYATRGFAVISQTSNRATLQKSKKFNVAIGIVGFLFCFLGLAIYAIIYAAQADHEVIDIRCA